MSFPWISRALQAMMPHQVRGAIAAAVTGLLLLSPALASAGVMTLPNSVAVDQTGSADVSIPIAVPPGTSGMAPSLSVDYSSANGNGDIGVGWKLSGLPAIVRCPKTIATNGVIEPITLTSADVFCLQGRLIVMSSQPLLGGNGQQQLRLTSGTYGANQATYATEVESFSRIVSSNTTGANGPTSFTIYDRSGLIYDFGGVSGANSQVGCTNPNTTICPSGQTTITTWALDKVTDTAGNTMTVTYAVMGGRILPNEIDYTANSAKGVSATNHIQFHFSPGFRPDSSYIYQAGQQVQLTTLLQSIVTSVTTSSGTSTVSTYAFSYMTGMTGASLLQKVTRTGASGGTLAPLTFGYTSSAPYDMLSVVNNGANVGGGAGNIQLSYGLTTQTSLYTPNPFSGTGSPSFPSQNLMQPRYVVSSLQVPNGVGGTYNRGYGYSGGLTDLYGRGFLGFADFAQSDLIENTESNTQYYQFFPIIGVAGGYQNARYANGSWLQIQSATMNYAYKNAYNGRNFYYPSSVTTAQTDLQGNAIPSQSVTYTEDTYGNQLTKAFTTTQSYHDIASNPASNLNTLFSKTITVAYQNDAAGWTPTNGANWIIGRPTSDTVAASFTDNNNSANSSAAVTRQSTFTPSQTTGFISTASIEPGVGTGFTLTDTFQYDGFGHMQQVAAAGDGQNRISGASYGSSSDPGSEFPSQVTNPLSQSETRQYDVRFGGPSAITDINGQTTQYAYDDLGRLTSKTLNDGSVLSIAYNWCSGYNGGTTSCPTGSNAVYVISTNHVGVDGSTELEPQTSTFYDMLDRLVCSAQTGFDGTVTQVSRTYNAKMQLASVSRPYFPASQQPANTTYTYDQLSRPTQVNHPDGSWDTFAYVQTGTTAYTGITSSFTGHYKFSELDGDGNLMAAQQSVMQGSTLTYINTAYHYDGFDDLLRVVDNAGNTTSYNYDALGRKITVHDPDAGSRTMTYSAYDELISVLDGNSVTNWTTYDALSRPTSRCYSTGQTGAEQQACSLAQSNPTAETLSTWTYDPTNGIGRLSGESSTHGIGSSSSYSYNTLGQPSATTITVGGTYNFAYTYAYDSNHRPSSFTTPSGDTHGVTYNAQGYPASLVDDSANEAMWTVNQLDAELHTTSATYGNGTTYQASYSALTGWIASLDTQVSSGSSTLLQNFAYNWDSSGNLLQRNDVQNSLNEAYSYDLLNRLNAVTQIGSPNTTEVSFAYDLLGDMTSKSDVGTYTFPTAGSAHPHGVASIANVGGGSTNITYDNDGQILTETGTIARTISWTLFNKPAATTYGSGSFTFQYDADGNEIMRVGPQGMLIYVPDGTVSLSSGQSQSNWSYNSYYIADGQRIGESYGKAGLLKHHFFHNDHQGSVLMVTDDSFNPAAPANDENIGYDAYGQPRNLNGTPDPNWGSSTVTKRGYVNQELLTGMRLINLNARFYDPNIAQFTAPDPIINDPSDSQAWNAYAYSGNNPLSLSDPTGLDPNADNGIKQIQNNGSEYQSAGDDPSEDTNVTGNEGTFSTCVDGHCGTATVTDGGGTDLGIPSDIPGGSQGYPGFSGSGLGGTSAPNPGITAGSGGLLGDGGGAGGIKGKGRQFAQFVPPAMDPEPQDEDVNPGEPPLTFVSPIEPPGESNGSPEPPVGPTYIGPPGYVPPPPDWLQKLQRRADSLAPKLELFGGGKPRLVPTPNGAKQFIFPNKAKLRFDIKPPQYKAWQEPHINLETPDGENEHIPVKPDK